MFSGQKYALKVSTIKTVHYRTLTTTTEHYKLTQFESKNSQSSDGLGVFRWSWFCAKSAHQVRATG